MAPPGGASLSCYSMLPSSATLPRGATFVSAMCLQSLDLLGRARLRLLVVAPAQQARAVAEAPDLYVVGRDLDHVARLHRDHDALASGSAARTCGRVAGEPCAADYRRELGVRSGLVVDARASASTSQWENTRIGERGAGRNIDNLRPDGLNHDSDGPRHDPLLHSDDRGRRRVCVRSPRDLPASLWFLSLAPAGPSEVSDERRSRLDDRRPKTPTHAQATSSMIFA